MRILLTAVLGVVILTGCVTATQPPVMEISSPEIIKKPDPPIKFNKNEVSWFKRTGSSSIKGSTDELTCAGNNIFLIPQSKYAISRMIALYKSTERGFNSRDSMQQHTDIADADYVLSTKATRCDGDGNFEFNNVPVGKYFVVAEVSGVRDGTSVAGNAMIQVRVDGKSPTVVNFSL